jgi:hypothetical protein
MPKVSEQQKLIEGFLLKIIEASAPPSKQQQRLSDARNYLGLTDRISPEVAQRLVRGLIEGGSLLTTPCRLPPSSSRSSPRAVSSLMRFRKRCW